MLSKKNVIFDFDGTIADTVPVVLTMIEGLAQEVGYAKKITAEDLEWVRDHELKDIPHKFGIPWIKVPYLLIKGRELLNKQMFSIPPCKGILELLTSLKKNGYTLAILSSNRRDSIQEFILKYKLEPFFDFVHSELNIFGKDKALLSLLKQYKMPIEESIYVGDEMRDVEACRKIKLDCISVGWGLNTVEALRRYNTQWVVTKPQEIVELLKENHE
jgi:phosphoglycolate phosphatase-like HAD superfamily hydrolase